MGLLQEEVLMGKVPRLQVPSELLGREALHLVVQWGRVVLQLVLLAGMVQEDQEDMVVHQVVQQDKVQTCLQRKFTQISYHTFYYFRDVS